MLVYAVMFLLKGKARSATQCDQSRVAELGPDVEERAVATMQVADEKLYPKIRQVTWRRASLRGT